MTPTMSDILFAVQRITGVTIAEMRSDRQSENVMTARKLVYFVANQCFSLSHRDIGCALNGHHGSVGNMIRKLTEETGVDPELVDKVEDEVERILAGRAQTSRQVGMR